MKKTFKVEVAVDSLDSSLIFPSFYLYVPAYSLVSASNKILLDLIALNSTVRDSGLFYYLVSVEENLM